MSDAPTTARGEPEGSGATERSPGAPEADRERPEGVDPGAGPGEGPASSAGAAQAGDAGPLGEGTDLEDRRRFSLQAIRDFVTGVPRFVKLLYRLMRDRRVSRFDRVLFGLTLAYLVTPLDLVPDWLPVVGGLDDLILVVVALDRLLYRTDEAVLREHWEGDARPLLVLRDLLDRGARTLPEWARGLLRSG